MTVFLYNYSMKKLQAIYLSLYRYKTAKNQKYKHNLHELAYPFISS